MAREEAVASRVEPMESWAGRWGRWMGWVGFPKPGLTGGVKSREVVHCILMFGWQTEERLAVA